MVFWTLSVFPCIGMGYGTHSSFQVGLPTLGDPAEIAWFWQWAEWKWKVQTIVAHRNVIMQGAREWCKSYLKVFCLPIKHAACQSLWISSANKTYWNDFLNILIGKYKEMQGNSRKCKQMQANASKCKQIQANTRPMIKFDVALLVAYVNISMCTRKDTTEGHRFHSTKKASEMHVAPQISQWLCLAECILCAIFIFLQKLYFEINTIKT